MSNPSESFSPHLTVRCGTCGTPSQVPSLEAGASIPCGRCGQYLVDLRAAREAAGRERSFTPIKLPPKPPRSPRWGAVGAVVGAFLGALTVPLLAAVGGQTGTTIVGVLASTASGLLVGTLTGIVYAFLARVVYLGFGARNTGSFIRLLGNAADMRLWLRIGVFCGGIYGIAKGSEAGEHLAVLETDTLVLGVGSGVALLAWLGWELGQMLGDIADTGDR